MWMANFLQMAIRKKLAVTYGHFAEESIARERLLDLVDRSASDRLGHSEHTPSLKISSSQIVFLVAVVALNWLVFRGPC